MDKETYAKLSEAFEVIFKDGPSLTMDEDGIAYVRLSPEVSKAFMQSPIFRKGVTTAHWWAFVAGASPEFAERPLDSQD